MNFLTKNSKRGIYDKNTLINILYYILIKVWFGLKKVWKKNKTENLLNTQADFGNRRFPNSQLSLKPFNIRIAKLLPYHPFNSHSYSTPSPFSLLYLTIGQFPSPPPYLIPVPNLIYLLRWFNYPAVSELGIVFYIHHLYRADIPWVITSKTNHRLAF